MMEFSARNNNISDEEWMNKMSTSMNQSVDQELLRRLRANGGMPIGSDGSRQGKMLQNGGSGVNGVNGNGSEEELLLQLLYQRRRRQGMGGMGGMGGPGVNFDTMGGEPGNPMTNLFPTDEEKLMKLRDHQAAAVVSRRNSMMGAAGGPATERRSSLMGSFSENSGSNMSGGPNTNSNSANGMMGGTGGAFDGSSSLRRPSMMGGIGAPGGAMFNGMGGFGGMSGMGNMGGLAGMGGLNGMATMGIDPYHQDSFGPMGVSSAQASEYLNPQRVDISSSRLLALQRQQDMMGMQSGLFPTMNGMHPNPVSSSFLMDRERMMDLNLYGHTREQLAQAQAHSEKLMLREQLQHRRQLQQNQLQNGVNLKKKRAPARKKTPNNKPRRPLSAYNLFFSEERERILKEIDEKTALEKGEKVKKEKEEDGEDKEKSTDKEEKVEENKEEGKEEKLEENKEESKEESKEEIKEESKEEKDDKQNEDDSKRTIPKAFLRPLLPGQRKRRAHRKTHGKISFRLLAQMVGARWKALPDDERKYYQDLAKEDSLRQKEAMKEYYRMEQQQQDDPTLSMMTDSSVMDKLEPDPIPEIKDEDNAMVVEDTKQSTNANATVEDSDNTKAPKTETSKEQK